MRRLFFLICSVLAACDIATDPQQPGGGGTGYNSVLSLNTNLSSNEPVSNYSIEYKEARSAGARGAHTTAPWATLNPSATTYDLTMLTNEYFGLDELNEMGYETIFLNIPIITIDQRSLPSDIIGLNFDDPLVKNRFRALIDKVVDEFNERVKFVSLGNEVDTYFKTHSGEWPAYINLVKDARNYFHSLIPDIQVGVTTTFEGASVSAATEIGELNESMDVVMLTYYPVNSNFIPRAPSTVKPDVARMLDISGGKPLVVQEWGYPSSIFLGSSEQKQADFYSNSFLELKNYSERFPFVSFFKYRDWNEAPCQVITGQTAGQNFYEFMSSLGMRKNDGTSKPAFDVLQEELN